MIKYLSCFKHLILVFLCLLAGINSFAQDTKRNFTIGGTVYEQKGNKGPVTPISSATVSISEYGINAATSTNGRFSFTRVPSGKVKLSLSYLGKITLDTLIDVQSDLDLKFYLAEADFRLKEVNVTASNTDNSNGTSSKISRSAIDHLQAASLTDLLSLLPGGPTINPNLANAKQITLRNVGSPTQDLNAFGTSIIINGAPVSNNANLQTMSPAVSGASGSLGGGASPGAGFDVRTVSLDNVESVEIIRGVPGVQYGDVTAGVMLVNTKAGAQPLNINVRTNSNLYQFSATKGLDLGAKKGALNLGIDYASNVTSPVQSYLNYKKITGTALYSNTFFDNLKSTTSLDLLYGKDTRKPNPDDLVNQISSKGQDLGFIFNTRGNLSFDNAWLRAINYVARVGYTVKDSYYETLYTSATSPYSMTYTDGAILTNKPNTPVFDTNGQQLTNISPADQSLYAIALPSAYLGRYDINGKEFNTYFKTVATFFNRVGVTNHRWLLGADFKSDKNYGDGKTFSDTAPPYRNLSAVNASFRQRVYKDIAGLDQFGLFAEDQLNAKIGENHLLLVAGLRYDRFSGNRNALSPRINASLDIVPRVFSINGAYGQLAKAPAILHLSPEDAYFEYVNINETASAIPADQQVYMTTTRVFSTENPDLKIAKNKKSEIGFTLKVSQATLKVTGFRERLNNGYALSNTVNGYKPVTYNEYVRANAAQPVYQLSQSNPVLAKFYMPNNAQVANTEGIEADLNLGRFDAIRSAFTLNGAYIRTESYSNDYFFYDGQSTTGGAGRTHIGLYEKGMAKEYNQSFVTALRSTHNIPQLGFVVTLTTQVTWNESNQTKFGNDSIPVKYISKIDGQIYDFDASRAGEDQFKTLIRPTNPSQAIKESYPPLLNFNFNLTKEIEDYLRVSFFANNMFRYYQITESKRNPGTFIKRNSRLFFGLGLSLKIK
ncbi:TonB-dependent receptor [Pedobacter metabolipauper]|uniref:Outer membrane receptor for ferrienterochelin and colicin n=1 Tax=Pedobacter metabolipauper TaxID=425513 RepID=A0A4R6T0X2_9SPHI|nr:carboxypeptidase-like regulatory domain-containing protein [Pedobacter metabolipauper]TDQ12037.1 outer membrane receptor for ferrienterochelin and colicin [Pedobacter metabolipauper]